jgi:diguanylate cyclase (GGDEF)-like protein/PAS domain S-box-containing protein
MFGLAGAGAAQDVRRRWLRITLAALLASLAGLIGVTLESAYEARDALADSARQKELANRARQLQDVAVAVSDAETGQRGYLLTGNPRYLAPYRSAIARLPALMQSLDQVGSADPAFAPKAEAARQLIADKLAELDQTVRLQAGGQHDKAMALVLSDHGQDTMERSRVAMDEVLQAVRGERDAMAAEVAAAIMRIQQLLLVAVSSLVLFVALALAQAWQAFAARMRFEQALAASERRHRALVEDQSELVALSHEDGTLVYVNPAFARHYERTPEALIGTNRYELVDPAERDATRIEFSIVLRTGRERRNETRSQAADGTERWVAWTNKRLQEAGGALLHSVGRDITERKRSDRALRASQAFLHRTGRLAGIGGWEADLRTGTGIWSEEVRRILEVDDDFVPRRDDELTNYAPEARPAIEKAVADCIERGVSWDLELPRFTATGRRIWVRTVGSLEFENGQPRRIVGALQDITERKTLEERLAAGERFLRQITDSLQVRIAYFDAQSRYRFVNLAHCRRYGRKREDILGHTRKELTGRSDPLVEARIAAVLRGEPQQFEYEDRTGAEDRPERARRIDAHLLPDVDDEGHVRGFYATGVDITDRVAAERRLRELTQVLELTPDFVVQTDRHGGVQYMNPSLRRALGLAPGAPIAGLSFSDFVTPQTNARYLEEIRPLLHEHGSWLGETTAMLEGGRAVPVTHLAIAHRDADGRIERFSAVMRDISTEVAARQALLLQTTTLQSVTEALPAMVTVIGRDGRYRFVNSAFERWAGVPRERLLGRHVEDIVSAEEHAALRPWIARALAGESVNFETTHPARRIRHLAMAYIPLHGGGEVDGYVAVALDVTLHKEETGRLLQLAQRDALTGLLNRAGLEAWLACSIEESGIGSLALLLIDLDRFKPVNDTYGHPAGDAVLRLVGQRLADLVRPSDAVARIGGDEFAIGLAGVRDRAHAEAIAAKIVAAAGAPFLAGELDLRIGASVGIAFQVPGAKTWQALAEHADGMLYRAKAAGRSTYA